MTNEQNVATDEQASIVAWRNRSQKGEVCGMLNCKSDPEARCVGCRNVYCWEHSPTHKSSGHPEGKYFMERL